MPMGAVAIVMASLLRTPTLCPPYCTYNLSVSSSATVLNYGTE